MKRIFKFLTIMAILGTASACAQHRASGYAVVSAAQFSTDIHNDPTAFILDVRTPKEYAEGHIDNAHNLDWLNTASFKAGAEKLPKSSTIYVYCRSGARSAEASKYLSSLGYKVVDLDGGYLAWTASQNNN